MSEILDRSNAIVGDSILRDQTDGHIEIVAPCGDTASGITLSAGIGNIDFKTGDLSGYVNLTETGVTGLSEVNGYTSIIGVLNQVGKFYISGNDTTADYAENKIIATSGIVLTTLNDGGNEQLEISINPSIIGSIVAPYVVHNELSGLQGGVGGEFYHLTAQQLIDLTSGISADDQHWHSASGVHVDQTCFDIISGADLQSVLCAIDEALHNRITQLVNFDIAGSVRNGNTCLGIDTGVPYVQFRDDKTGIAAFTARVPKEYINGSPLSVQIKWFSTGANTNNIVWELDYKTLASGELISTAASTVQVISTEPGVIGQVVETDFAVSGSTFLVDDVMIFELKRVGGDALDTSTDPSRVIEFTVDY